MRVEIAQHGADVGRAGEILKHVEPVLRLARGGKPADRRARDRADVDAMTVKRPEHADMRPAKRRPAAERQRDRDRKSTRLNSSHSCAACMPSSSRKNKTS